MQQINGADGRTDEEPDQTAPPALGCYITPGGLDRFRVERATLRHQERPRIVDIVSWAAGNGDRSENGDYLYGKRRLREIDHRLRFLDRRIKHAIVVDPADRPAHDRVLFGAAVIYAGEDDLERQVTIIGVDEAETARGQISLASPVARALLGRRVGDEVALRLPGGIEVAEIRAIAYPDDL